MITFEGVPLVRFGGLSFNATLRRVPHCGYTRYSDGARRRVRRAAIDDVRDGLAVGRARRAAGARGGLRRSQSRGAPRSSVCSIGIAGFVSDGGGKVPAALNVIEGRGRVAAFLAGVVRKGWTDEMSVRFDTINGLPGLILRGPAGLIQTSAFEIEDDLVEAIYVVRNPDKLRHLAPSPAPGRDASSRGHATRAHP